MIPSRQTNSDTTTDLPKSTKKSQSADPQAKRRALPGASSKRTTGSPPGMRHTKSVKTTGFSCRLGDPQDDGMTPLCCDGLADVSPSGCGENH